MPQNPSTVDDLRSNTLATKATLLATKATLSSSKARNTAGFTFVPQGKAQTESEAMTDDNTMFSSSRSPTATELETFLDRFHTDNTNDDASSSSSSSYDQQISFHMPAEWAPHSACLILWPHNRQTFRVDLAQTQVLHLAQQVATQGQEDVFLLCPSTEEKRKVQEMLERDKRTNDPLSSSLSSNTIHVCVCPSDDTWARDTAPIFVWKQRRNDQHHRNLIGLDWAFNAYGGPDDGCYWPCDKDQQIAKTVCGPTLPVAAACHIQECLSVPMILEGGSIHVDGEGTMVTTQECLLNPNRNPQLTKAQIETTLKTCLGVQHILWLPVGLDADDDTNGHVDNFCAFVRPGHVVLSWTDDKEGDFVNYQRCRQAEAFLQDSTDAKGRKLQITKLTLPSPPLRYTLEECKSLQLLPGGNDDDDGQHDAAVARQPHEPMAASYVNFYICNKAVMVPQFGGTAQKTDEMALQILQAIFEEEQPQPQQRTVVGIPSREILLGGGNIHCQIQQIPAETIDEK